jgi:hypothetical protein
MTKMKTHEAKKIKVLNYRGSKVFSPKLNDRS